MSQTPAERQATYRAKNRERLAEEARLRYHRYRAEVFEMLGAQCNICGFSDTRALEIDHAIPRRVSGRMQWHTEMLHLRAHPEEYQVLCSNCHKIKTRTVG